MKKILGLLLEKIQKRERNSALFVDEARNFVFALIISIIGLEIFLLVQGNYFDIQSGSFVLSIMGLYLLCVFFEDLIKLFATGKFIALISIIPLVALIFVFKANGSPLLIAAAIIAAVLRLGFSYIKVKNQLLLYGIYFLDGAALYMWWLYQSFMQPSLVNRLLFAGLVAMTISSLQQLAIEKNKGAFPLHYFLILALIITALPMKDKPIDWTPVKTVWGKISDASENAAYYISNVYDKGGYSSGYSSLNVTGGKIKKSKKPQLSLTTAESPYYVYTDENTGKRMQTKKVLYLEGLQHLDKKQLVDFLNFLNNHDVDRIEAGVFSQISKVNVEYIYLNTEDEIVPSGTIALKGDAEGKHKKGYSLSATYLDIDYGSPYLIDLLETEIADPKTMSYEEAGSYMKDVYRMDLDSVISKEEYEDIVSAERELGQKDNDGKAGKAFSEYTDTTGVTSQMEDLAKEITAKASSDYDKCKLIETYLRQYRYNVDAVGGHDEDSTMVSAAGMTDIADRFLFETKEGYCVHFTSSMVMLLRASGIPARVQNGYRYSFPFEAEEDYVVQANCAHVWPEAYINGVGWIPFEPTSGYYRAEDITWHRKGAEESALENYKSLEQAAVPELEEELSYNKKEINRLFVLVVVGVIVLSIIFLIGLAIATTALVRHLKYKHASLEEKLAIDVENIKSVIEKNSKEKIEDRGFLSDYIKLVPAELKAEVENVFALHYKVLYSDDSEDDISEQQSIKAKELCKQLKNIN